MWVDSRGRRPHLGLLSFGDIANGTGTSSKVG